jgi:hypothetical protein
MTQDTMARQNPIFALLWIILLVFLAWPVAYFAAGVSKTALAITLFHNGFFRSLHELSYVPINHSFGCFCNHLNQYFDLLKTLMISLKNLLLGQEILDVLFGIAPIAALLPCNA